MGPRDGRSGYLGSAAFTQIDFRSKQLAQLIADPFGAVLVTAKGFCGLRYGQRVVFLLGSCPKLASRFLVRLSAGEVPHFRDLGGPSSAPKTSVRDDKGES